MKMERNNTTGYEAFFLAGSFLMAPELLVNNKSRQLTKATVRMGLALDDVWDFGINRGKLAGQGFLEPRVVCDHADQTIYQQFVTSKLELRRSLDSLPYSPNNRRKLLNMERFEQGIMLVEGLALAIPYDDAHWTMQLVDQYRCTGALVWGAMYVALRPKATLVLPNPTIYKDMYTSDYTIGLSRLYTDYFTHLLKTGTEGYLAISLALQMLYVQIEMDTQDKSINKSYHSPAFAIFSENDFDLHRIKADYLEQSEQYSPTFSITRTIARLFPYVYGFLSSNNTWRNIDGWNTTYHELKTAT